MLIEPQKVGIMVLERCLMEGSGMPSGDHLPFIYIYLFRQRLSDNFMRWMEEA